MDGFEEEGIVQLLKEKGAEMKNLQGKIRKLKQEIKMGSLKDWPTIGRNLSRRLIPQIDQLADEFRKGESPDGIHDRESDGNQNYGGVGEELPVGEYLDRHPIPQVAER